LRVFQIICDVRRFIDQCHSGRVKRRNEIYSGYNQRFRVKHGMTFIKIGFPSYKWYNATQF